MTGYEGLRTHAAWFDLSGRGLIRMTGEDRARLLHAMTTNDIQRLSQGHGCYAFFLNAQGRILADVNVFTLEDAFLLDTEPEVREKVLLHLDQYIIADDVTLTDESSQWGVLGVEGPESASVMKKLGAPAPGEPWDIEIWEGGLVAAVSATGASGFRIFVPAAEKEDMIARLQAAGVPEADNEEVNVVRLEHGKPRYGVDISERYLTQETNQMHAISFAKGCYLGQEIVERVRSRAQIHRMLHPVRIRSSNAPSTGKKLAAEGKDVAEITSAAFSPALREVVALAYVRIDQLQSKKEMEVGGEDGAAAYLP